MARDNNIKDLAKIKALAMMIAGDIMKVNTDMRGQLLELVADTLRDSTQGFTARCIQEAADLYNRGA